MRRILLLAVVACSLVSGCAVFNRENTPTLNFVERNMLPRESRNKALYYPVAIPAGMVAASLDMFLVHPAMVVTDAWDDTRDALWSDHFDWDTRYVTTSASLLPRVVATPLVAGGSFMARSVFDIPQHGGRPKKTSVEDKAARVAAEEKRKELGRKVDEARRALAAGERDSALVLANEVLCRDAGRIEALQVKAAVLMERGDMDAVAALPRLRQLFAEPRFADGFVAFLDHGPAAGRMQALYLLENVGAPTPVQEKDEPRFAAFMSALRKNLADGDRALQLKTLQLLGKYQYANIAARELLAGVAHDSDPVLAVAAKGLMR